MLTFGVLSSSKATERLKSGNGTDARAFTKMFTTTSGLYRSGLNWYLKKRNTSVSCRYRGRKRKRTVLELQDSRGSHIPCYEFGDRGNPRGFRRLMDCNGL